MEGNRGGELKASHAIKDEGKWEEVRLEIRIVTVAKKDSGGECLGVVDGVWSVVSSGSPFKLPKWFSLPLHGGLHAELQSADGPPHPPPSALSVSHPWSGSPQSSSTLKLQQRWLNLALR